MNGKLTTELFGDIEITPGEGFYGDIKELKSGLTFHLDIFEEIEKPESFLKISEFLDDWQKLDQEAKKHLLQALENEDSTVQYYYDFHKEELQDELNERLNNEEQTNENLLQYTELSSIWFSLEKEEIIATVDYKLIDEYSDEILAVRFNQEKQIISIAHES